MSVDTGVRTKLESFGVSAQDAEAAIKLYAMIQLVHSTVYPGQIPHIEFPASQGPQGTVAQYRSKTPDRAQDGYAVFAKYFRQNLADMVRTQDGGTAKLGEFPLEEMIINVACHEVRHCVQYREDISLFKYGIRYRAENELLAEVVKTLNEFFKHEWYTMSDTEFDAHVVGFYAMYKLLIAGTAASELGELIRVQPEIYRTQ